MVGETNGVKPDNLPDIAPSPLPTHIPVTPVATSLPSPGYIPETTQRMQHHQKLDEIQVSTLLGSILLNLGKKSIPGKIHQTKSETNKITVGCRSGNGLRRRGLRKRRPNMARQRFLCSTSGRLVRASFKS